MQDYLPMDTIQQGKIPDRKWLMNVAFHVDHKCLTDHDLEANADFFFNEYRMQRFRAGYVYQRF